MVTIILIALFLSTLNAYLLLSLDEGHWAYDVGKYIKPQCTSCRAFWWLGLPEGMLFSIIYVSRIISISGLSQPAYCVLLMLLPFFLAATSTVIYRFLKG